MTYITMEAEIDHGRIIPAEPEKLPVSGRALLTVLSSHERKPDYIKIKALLGKLRTDIDTEAWQREIRSEWNGR